MTGFRKGETALLAALGGVSDVAAIGSGAMAITGEPLDAAFTGHAQKLFRISKGRAHQVADLRAFEDMSPPEAARSSHKV